MRTVLRHQLSRKPFVTIANEVARDSRLSFAARGVLLDMLSRPLNWQFSAERIADGSPFEGRKAVLRCLRELEDYGYLCRHRTRGAGGQIRTLVIVSDEPIADWATVVTPKSPKGTPAPESPHGTSVDGTSVEGASKEAQSKKPREETQSASHSSIPPAGPRPRTEETQSSDRVGTDASAGRELALAMDGWNQDRRRRKPWAELQQAYDEGRIDETDVLDKLDELLGGWHSDAEERTAVGMLANGAHLKAIYNTARANRRAS